MQSNYVNETTGTSYLFGIDRVGGLFMSKSTEEGILNFTQFYPFHERFTHASVIENIPAADLEVIKCTPIGEYKVFFKLATKADFNGYVPEELFKHSDGDYDFFVNTWGELFDLMACFNENIFFYEMTLVCQSDEEGSMGGFITWENEVLLSPLS